MSFFRTQQTQLCDQKNLVKTLEDLGYKPQVNEKKITVRGHGTESDKAEIILRKEDTGEGGDIGFSKNKDGNFDIILDTYVMRKTKLPEFTKQVALKYGENKVKAIAKKQGFTILKTTNKDGQTVVQMKVG